MIGAAARFRYEENAMSKLLKCSWLLLLVAVPLWAQQMPLPAPVPPKLLSKTVFLSNAGADSGLFPSPFSGGTSRAYDYMYKALTAGGVYTLVDDPAKADVVFELRVTAPEGPQSPNKTYGAADPLPMARLVVYDRATHYVLWTVSESIDVAYLQKTHDAYFDRALDRLVLDLKSVAIPTPTP
jgi:hypothetical protein